MSKKRWANLGALTIGLIIGIAMFGLAAYVNYTDYEKAFADKDISDAIANNYLRSASLYAAAGGGVVFLFALMCLTGQTGRNGSSIAYLGFIFFALAFLIYLFIGTPDPTGSGTDTLYTSEIYDRWDSQIDDIGDRFDVESNPTISQGGLFIPLAIDNQASSESIMFTGLFGLGCLFLGLGLFGARGIGKVAGLFFLLGGVACLASIQINAKNVDWTAFGLPEDKSSSDYERYIQITSGALGGIALGSLFGIFTLASKGKKDESVDLTKDMKLPKKTGAPGGMAPPAQEEGVRFCPECGENLPKGAPYCPFCGFKL